jgi:hypothetical protein
MLVHEPKRVLPALYAEVHTPTTTNPMRQSMIGLNQLGKIEDGMDGMRASICLLTINVMDMMI